MLGQKHSRYFENPFFDNFHEIAKKITKEWLLEQIVPLTNILINRHIHESERAEGLFYNFR